MKKYNLSKDEENEIRISVYFWSRVIFGLGCYLFSILQTIFR